jgi:hypothetical protein
MQTYKIENKNLEYPFEPRAINYWAKKWGINVQQVHDAILETGSIRPKVLREHLAKKGIIFSLSGYLRKLRSSLTLLMAKYNGSYYDERI